jgi:hypothetical protein
LLLSELAASSIEKGWMDMVFPTIGGNVHTAGRLVVDDGPPMNLPSFCCHLLPPDDEDFSLSGSIAQRRPAEKMGCSHAYAYPTRGTG